MVLSNINPLNANVVHVRHNADIACSGCSASYRQNHYGLGVLTVPYVISNSKFGLVSSYFPLKVLKDIFYYLKINTYLSFYKN